MIIYIFLIVVLFVLSLLELGDLKVGTTVKSVVTIALVAFSGFRYYIGSDYVSYVNLFSYPEDLPGLEWGFSFLIDFVHLVNGKVQLLFLLSAVLVMVPLAYVLNTFCYKYYITSLTVYVSSFIYFESMNTVRQAIAMSFMMCAICLFANSEKKRLFILFSLFAALFHYSALIISIVAYFVVKLSKSELKTKYLLFFLVFSFVIGRNISSLFSVLLQISSLLGYGQYMDNFEMRGVSTGSFQYLLNIYAIGTILYYKNAFTLSKFNVSILNLFVLSIIFYNLFIDFYIGLRFYWYFFLFIVFVIPMICGNFLYRQRIIVFALLIAPLLLFTLVSLNSVDYLPYNVSFNF